MRYGITFGVLVTAAVLGATLGMQPAVAQATESPTPSPVSAAPTGLATATDPAAPTDSVTAGASDPSSTASGLEADPSLAEMNATGNHTMGSTISTFDPSAPAVAASPKARSFAAAPLAAVAVASPPSGVPGMDVSSYQTTNASTWTAAYANGARFVYVKATESTNYTNEAFSEQYTGSYNAGLIHGAYHFAHPNATSGAVQANYFVNNGGGWSNDGKTLPPLLDIEYNPSGATCYGLSQSAMVSWIADFSNTVKSRTGRVPAIYSTTDWWKQCTGNTNKFSANPLFIASWPSNTSAGPGTLPAGWSNYTFWQWADSGIFPGDQDVFNGTLSQLVTFARNSSTTQPIENALRAPIIGVGDLNGDGKPDFVARRPDGTLWFYAGTGAVGGSNQGYKPAVQISTGWNAYDDIVGVGDFNSDGKQDLLARKPDGTLWFFAGTGKAAANAAFSAPVKIGMSGWDAYDEIIAAGDVNGDHHPDLFARKPDGTLWFYAGTGTVNSSNEGYLPAVQIGNGGWDAYQQVLGIGDLNRDGHPDLVAMRQDGTLWFYAGTGAAPWLKAAVKLNVAGISASDTLAAVGDLNSDGSPDLIARTLAGTLQFVGGSRIVQEGYAAAKKIGNGGWNAYTKVIAAGDLNGDKKPDLLAIRSDGTLWFYAGTGTAGKTEGYKPALKVGRSGWTAYTTVLGVGDLNGDGKPDLLGVRSDGTMWFYAGTGVVNSSNEGYKPAVKIGGGWNAYRQLIGPGDLSGDQKPDLIGTRADGSLWFYAGTGTASGTYPYIKAGARVAASGWSPFTALIPAGDMNSDGKPDVLERKSNGSLWLTAGTGRASATASGLSAAVQIGTSGWNAYRIIIGTGDFNSDGKADLVGVRTDGTLWFYAGTGNAGVPSYSLKAPVTIGSGWSIYQ